MYADLGLSPVVQLVTAIGSVDGNESPSDYLKIVHYKEGKKQKENRMCDDTDLSLTSHVH